MLTQKKNNYLGQDINLSHKNEKEEFEEISGEDDE
jgi:hypothetical protein